MASRETSVAWFQEQLRREPFDPHFRLSKRTRWAITVRDIVVGAGNLGALVIAGKALRSVNRPQGSTLVPTSDRAR